MKSEISLRIAIIGAGPVSLTLANILKSKGIPFNIYEASPEIRSAGGCLDLHPGSGQQAIIEAGVWNEFVRDSRPESDCDKIVQIDGEVLWDENLLQQSHLSDEEQIQNGRPEIDRRDLVKILLEHLGNDRVSYAKKLAEVVPKGSKYDLVFSDGTKDIDFDLVVGGDGAWSRVRNILTEEKPQYSGIFAAELWCKDVKTKSPWLDEYVGRGSMMAFGDGCAVQAQRQSDGSIRTYGALRVPEDFIDTCGIDWTDHQNARKQFVSQYFSHVGDDLQRVILESPDSLIPRPLYELPVGFKWPSRSGVTLIGDAAHVMTPYAGVGVNVGMTDSLVLGRQIALAWEGKQTLDAAIQAYEEEMFPRAEKFMAKTMRGKIGHFSENGARDFAERLKSHHAGTA